MKGGDGSHGHRPLSLGDLSQSQARSQLEPSLGSLPRAPLATQTRDWLRVPTEASGGSWRCRSPRLSWPPSSSSMAVSIKVVVLFTEYMFPRKKNTVGKKKYKTYTHLIQFTDLI